jgi:regulator of RNase E activity RraA
VCDILDDEYGGISSSRYLMEPQVRPVFPWMTVAGVVKTFGGAAQTEGSGPSPQTGEKALESIGAGDVVVYATNHCRNAACWGELMTTAALARGGTGLVTDGLARDLNRIETIKPPFPVFACGATPSSGKGRFALSEYDVPVWCGGVVVHPGDYIIGDLDGVVVIPQSIASDVIARCEDRLRTEEKVRLAFQNRSPIADVMRRYKVG